MTDAAVFTRLLRKFAVLGAGAKRLEQSEGMQQFVFQLFVAIHGQDQFAGRTNNASGALDGRFAGGWRWSLITTPDALWALRYLGLILHRYQFSPSSKAPLSTQVPPQNNLSATRASSSGAMRSRPGVMARGSRPASVLLASTEVSRSLNDSS